MTVTHCYYGVITKMCYYTMLLLLLYDVPKLILQFFASNPRVYKLDDNEKTIIFA